MNLPPALDERFDMDRELGSGGEADLLLVHDRATGDPHVVRLYRRQDLPLDVTKQERLRAADRQHLIGLVEWGQGEGCTWEILEYARHGSLDDLIRRWPTPWPAQLVWAAFNQLADAVTYAHSLGMVHRDIKPGNILVRTEDPLELVLADFGLATFLTATREMRRTSSRTSAYAAPEAATGEASHALDWWSLGIVLVELLTGTHPFQRPDGSWMDDVMIVRELTVHDIDLGDIPDERWRLLCRGLLTRAPEQRWGPAQTMAWRQGGSPRVAEVRRGPAYVFAGAAYDDPRALAGALRLNWGEGRRLLAGQDLRTPQFLALRDWAERCQLSAVTRVLDRPSRPDRALMQLILALDPDPAPVFAGRPLDGRQLLALAGEAAGPARSNAAEILDVVYEEGVLTVCDGLAGCEGYAILDDRWHRAVETAERRLAALPVPVDPQARRFTRARLLVASFDGQQDAFAEAARNAGRDPGALQQPWFRALVDERMDPAYRSVHHAVVLLAQPAAAERTAQQHVEYERQTQAAQRARVQQRRDSVDRISPVLGVLLGVVGVCLGLGALTGPAAIYFGVRARRAGHPAASNWAIGLGGLGFLIGVCLVISAVGSALNPGSQTSTP